MQPAEHEVRRARCVKAHSFQPPAWCSSPHPSSFPLAPAAAAHEPPSPPPQASTCLIRSAVLLAGEVSLGRPHVGQGQQTEPASHEHGHGPETEARPGFQWIQKARKWPTDRATASRPSMALVCIRRRMDVSAGRRTPRRRVCCCRNARPSADVRNHHRHRRQPAKPAKPGG